MLKRTIRDAALALSLASSSLLAGCGFLDQNFNFNGADQLAIQANSVQQVDLAQEIVDEAPAGDAGLYTSFKLTCSATRGSGLGGVPTNDIGRTCLSLATRIFQSDPINPQLRRDAVQARLLAASRAECQQFTQHLNTIQSFSNLALGTIATGAGAAGSIVTNAAPARLLAGLAAAATGTRAEFNSDVFYKEAVPVIVKAIKSSQDGYMRDVITANRQKNIAAYPLWDAIGDAFRYNDMCSLVSGIGALDQDITLADSPGLDAVNRTLMKTNYTQQIISQKIVDASTNDISTYVGRPTPGPSATSGAPSLSPSGDPADSYVAAQQALAARGPSVTASFTQFLQNTAADTPTTQAIQGAQTTVQAILTNATNNLKTTCSAKVFTEHQNLLTAQITLAQASDPATTLQDQIALDTQQSIAAASSQSIAAYAAATMQFTNQALGQLPPPATTKFDANSATSIAKTISTSFTSVSYPTLNCP